MEYISTRGRMNPVSFSDVVIEGLAPDGGLTLPESYPNFSTQELAEMRPCDYQSLAIHILSKFVGEDIPQADLERIIKKTYTKDVFGTDEITPLVTLKDNYHILGLSEGPTLSFKDDALQLLGNLFEYILEKRSVFINLVGATSGDTGSSAEEATENKANITTTMLFPLNGVEHFQAAQMCSKDAPNITNIGVEGNFDECQDLVKALNSDSEFKKEYNIGAVNSINWARVSAQVIYYFKGYFAATSNNNQVVDFTVPTGNFGNILAGYIAKQMGLPIRNLVLATNENRVLVDLFEKGIYAPWPKGMVQPTSSPSMDIGNASNFERLMYDITGRDPVKLELFMKSVGNGFYVDLSRSPTHGQETYLERLKATGIVAGMSTHKDRLRHIKLVYEKYGRLIDPHTADGIKVGSEFWDPDVPMIFLETAKPTKFRSTIMEAVEFEPPMPSWYDPTKVYEPNHIIGAKDLAGLKGIVSQVAIRH